MRYIKGRMMLKRGGIKSKLLLVVGVFGVAAAAASFNFAHNRAAATVPGVNKIVSLVSTGVQTANQGTELQQQLSADGKFVLFSSASTDLVANDTNGKIDLFVRNVQAGTTERVNVATNGTEANEGVMPDNSGLLREAVISADGRYVLFASKATNLVSTTFTSNTVQFYIRDRQLGTTTLMGVNDAGDPGDQYTGDGARPVGISSDGRIATYITAARNTGPMQFIPDGFSNPQYSYQYLYTKNLLTGKVKLLTPVNTGTYAGPWTAAKNSVQSAFASCDGALVAVQTLQSTLTADDQDASSDIFLIDIRSGYSVTLLSGNTHFASTGVTLTSLSCNGDYVGIATAATTLTDPSSTIPPSILTLHYYAFYRPTGAYHLVDQSTSGVPAQNSCPSCGTGPFRYMVISDSGIAVFNSHASLVAGTLPSSSYEKLYVRNIGAGTTELLSVGVNGQALSGAHRTFGVSADGKFATYVSQIAGFTSHTDANGKLDVIWSETGQ